MLLLLIHQNGLNKQLMLTNFAVLVVMAVVETLYLCGSIGDRQCSQKTVIVNGKNFINVIVVMFGGLGVLTDLPMNLLFVKNPKINQ
jgi:multisubunit Na+/H+ antiporter MnhB subunit